MSDLHLYKQDIIDRWGKGKKEKVPGKKAVIKKKDREKSGFFLTEKEKIKH